MTRQATDEKTTTPSNYTSKMMQDLLLDILGLYLVCIDYLCLSWIIFDDLWLSWNIVDIINYIGLWVFVYDLGTSRMILDYLR